MTELEIVSSVLELVTSAEGVTNLSLSPDQVADEVDTLRIRLINEMDGQSLFRRPYQGFTQLIKSVTVVKPTGSEPYIDVPRIVMKRSAEPAFLYIGGTDDISPYRVVTGEYQNAFHDMFLETKQLAHYAEGRITFFSKNKPTIPANVRVVAVFEDPSKLDVFNEYDPETTQYPIQAGMLDILIGKTADSYIRTMYRVRPQPNTQSDIPNAGPQPR